MSRDSSFTVLREEMSDRKEGSEIGGGILSGIDVMVTEGRLMIQSEGLESEVTDKVPNNSKWQVVHALSSL
jgi:hypothetical protein